MSGGTAARAAPYVLGVSGAQGSGKSTLCRRLAARLEADHGLSTVVLSIDDVYRTRAERRALGRAVHPLCAVRGLPGTHDVGLALRVLDALAAASPDATTEVPRFDKAHDDRVPRRDFDRVVGRPDVVLLEGWCVAAVPGPPWTGPMNAREARDDPDGTWVRWSERALAVDYPPLWRRLDALLFIASPSWEAVVAGRCQQEASLARRLRDAGRAEDAVGLMTEAQVVDYVALFERKTRQLLAELPAVADWVHPHWLAADHAERAPATRDAVIRAVVEACAGRAD